MMESFNKILIERNEIISLSLVVTIRTRIFIGKLTKWNWLGHGPRKTQIWKHTKCKL